MDATPVLLTLLALLARLPGLARPARLGDECDAGGGARGLCSLAADCPHLDDSDDPEDVPLCALDPGSSQDDALTVVCCEQDAGEPEGPERDAAVPGDAGDAGDAELSGAAADCLRGPPAFDPLRAATPGYVSDLKCCEYVRHAFEEQWIRVGEAAPRRSLVRRCRAHHEVIVGGQPALDREFPHMALLGYDVGGAEGTRWACGGSLISERFVLTAAHCVDTSFGRVRWALLGARDLTLVEPHRHRHRVAEALVPPDFDYPARYVDVSLLRLEQPAALGPWLRPACLHAGPAPPAGARPFAAGWGADDPVASVGTSRLMKVQLEEFLPEECMYAARHETVRYPRGFLPERLVCAGSRARAGDTCRGDSGGPLQLPDAALPCMLRVYAVTSAGKLCGRPGLPAFYVRLTHHLRWIESTVWPDLAAAAAADR